MDVVLKVLLIVFEIVAAFAVFAIGYRLIFKRLFDFLAAVVCMVVTSPIWLIVFIRGKVYQNRAGDMETLMEREYFVGRKAEAVALHTFKRTNDDGEEAGDYGRWLGRTGFYKLPVLVDILCGRMSFLGVKCLSLSDAALVSEADEGRFSVRPGIINPLAVRGDKNTDYKEMFLSDNAYARKFNLFGDWKIFFVWLIKTIRGEKGEYFGVTAEKSYAQTLLDEGAITREDFEAVKQNAIAEEKELRRQGE